MTFDAILGQEHIKNHLKKSTDNGRIPHAQLFIGKAGTGTLSTAIAYANYILCKFSNNPEASAIKCSKLQHPDMHFAFPVTTTDSVKKHPISDLFLENWRTFRAEKPYGNLFNWLQHIGVENKQGLIGVDEAESIVKKLQLKSYEGGFKVMLIWMAEKMNMQASNKLLKLIEEPPSKTIFILVTEDEEQLINTIKSRCQALHFPVLSETVIAENLQETQNISKNEAINIAHQSEGSFNKALEILHHSNKDTLFEEWFITWIRSAFRAKGNAAVIQDLIGWSENIAASGRETQKQFLQYCLHFFRQSLLTNYGTPDLVFLETTTANFSIKKFAPFIHSANIVKIVEEVSNAQYHIERNGNAKNILLDLSIKLTRLLHQKEDAIKK